MKKRISSLLLAALTLIMPSFAQAQKVTNPNTKATYYVSKETGNNKNDGSKAAPFKNIQKAINVAESGSTIIVAKGNYFGLSTSPGQIVIEKKTLTIEGGWNTSFTERDVLKYKTMVQPGPETNGSHKGGGTIQIISVNEPSGYVIIDGLIIDRGNTISYNMRGEGKPEGVASPMMNPIGTKGIGGENLDVNPVLTQETNMIKLIGNYGIVNNVNIIVRNCAFLNCPAHGIQGNLKGGSLTVENCVFCNVRNTTLDVQGADPNTMTQINFRNNTVMFVWSHTRALDTWGHGYRMRPGTCNTVENNIFGCCCFSAIDKTFVDGNKAREAKRKDVVKNNVIFLSRGGDLCIPGGGMLTRVAVEDWDDVENIDCSGNISPKDPSIFKGKVNEAYLNGFTNLKGTQEWGAQYSSAANQWRSAMGMNIVGEGKITASMYANRYPWTEALNLFGVMSGKGAQKP